MAHKSDVLLIMTSTIGEMMANEKACPPHTTQNDIMIFFSNIIKEQELSEKLKTADLGSIKNDIANYFDVKVTSSKNKLIAEEASEAAAELVAGAAMAAAAIVSWIPFVNFCVMAAATAATVTALALEIESEKLEKTVVADIANADEHIRKEYDSFKHLDAYSTAVNENTSFFPRFQLMASSADFRALLLSIVVIIKKGNNNICTAEDIKKIFLDYYELTQSDPILTERFAKVFRKINENTDPQVYNTDLLEVFSLVPAGVRFSHQVLTLVIVTTVTMRFANAAYVIANLNNLTRALTNLGLAEYTEFGLLEEESIQTVSVATRAVLGLGAIANIVFAGLQIKKAVDTDRQLTQAIADSKNGITDYYSSLITNSIDGN